MSDWITSWWSGLSEARRYRLLGGALALALLLLFDQLAADLLEQELAVFDAAVFTWVRSVQSPAVTLLMQVMTALGYPVIITVLGVAGIVMLYRRGQRAEPVALVASLLGGWLWSDMLKLQYRRPRPPGPWLAPAGGYSFGRACASWLPPVWETGSLERRHFLSRIALNQGHEFCMDFPFGDRLKDRDPK